jgi:hypothetical protein
MQTNSHKESPQQILHRPGLDIILDLNELHPTTDHVARLHIVEGRPWSAFWIRSPSRHDLLGLLVFGDRLIGRTSDSGSENPGSTPGPQATLLAGYFSKRPRSKPFRFRSRAMGLYLTKVCWFQSNGSKRFERFERLERFEPKSVG